MRKIIIMLMLIISSVSASSKGFSGQVDILGELPLRDCVTVNSILYNKWNYTRNFWCQKQYVKNYFNFGLNITGYYKVSPNFKVGLGVGAYSPLFETIHEYLYVSDYYDRHGINCMYVPLYIDLKWTFFPNRKISPFVDLKLGYQPCFMLTESSIYFNYLSEFNETYHRYEYDELEEFHVNGRSGMYVFPTVGVRFGGPVGFNIGIGYNALGKYRVSRKNYANPRKLESIDYKDCHINGLTLLLGVDF